MPRNGSGVYSKPAGTTAVPDTTIESAKYNSTIDDLVQDANTARPITAGGTGATSAASARTNLGFATTSHLYNKKGADVASASTLTLGDDGNYFDITGTTTITAIATKGVGTVIKLHFDASLTLTHHATDLILPDGANIITAAGDEAEFVEYATGDWRCTNYSRASENWVDVASATTTDIGAVASEKIRITGTTTITGLGTVAAGIFRRLRFAGVLTLTHNGTSLILPGAADITTAAGDVFEFISEGSGNWRCVGYMLAGTFGDGNVRVARVSASGTTVDFTGLPDDVVEIDVSIDGLSLNGNDTVSLWLGDAGGIETTGYAGSATVLVSGSSVSGANVTTSFRFGSASSSNIYSGNIRLRLSDSATNLWVCDGLIAFENTSGVTTTAGAKSLSATLTQIRLGSTAGTATFDAGGIQVSYRRT